MFGWALPKAAASYTKGYIERQCVFGPGKFSNEDLDRITANCFDEAEKCGDKYLMMNNRQIDVVYRGHIVPHRVSSAAEDINLRVSAWLKSANAGGGLKAMSWEDVLLSDAEKGAEVPRGLCELEVLASFDKARRAVEAFLDNGDQAPYRFRSTPA